MRVRMCGTWFITGILVSLLVACQETPETPVIGGVFVGYTYSEQPVVQEALKIDYGYTLKFWAYDLGGEARFVAYAVREGAGEYFKGVMRLTIEDPDGNAFTFYRNNDAEAVDAPITWTPHAIGIHKVNIQMDLLPPERKADVTFDVPLVRQPTSMALVGGVAAVIMVAVFAVGYSLRRRQRRA